MNKSLHLLIYTIAFTLISCSGSSLKQSNNGSTDATISATPPGTSDKNPNGTIPGTNFAGTGGTSGSDNSTGIIGMNPIPLLSEAWKKLSNFALPSAYAASIAPRIATVLMTSRAGWDAPGWQIECKFANVSSDYAGLPGSQVSFAAAELVQAQAYSNTGETVNSVFTPTALPMVSYTLSPGQSVTMMWSANNTKALPSKIVFAASHLNPAQVGLVQGDCYFFYQQGVGQPISHTVPVMAGLPF